MRLAQKLNFRPGFSRSAVWLLHFSQTVYCWVLNAIKRVRPSLGWCVGLLWPCFSSFPFFSLLAWVAMSVSFYFLSFVFHRWSCPPLNFFHFCLPAWLVMSALSRTYVLSALCMWMAGYGLDNGGQGMDHGMELMYLISPYPPSPCSP